uniref:Glutamate synthase alpha subunit C-terminal domain-containing protein n=1 Tax=Physcomitrium patens TaxID=3218 RepID=A0A2K1JGJ1_PHYPA|nr:hypothetical protein PHYPA_018074 [Physcomitrium patens]
MLSNKIIKLYKLGLSTNIIYIKYYKSIGQFLQVLTYKEVGQFLQVLTYKEITMELEGDSNNYVKKRHFDNKIIVSPPNSSTFDSKENILIGNIALYRVRSTQTYFNNMARQNLL